MKRARRLGLMTTYVLLAGLPAVATAQEVATERELARELAGIRVSLDRLVKLAESQLHLQRTELLIRRINLSEQRIEPLERRLRDAEATLSAREDELERLRAVVAERESALDEAVREGRTEEEGELRRMLREMDAVLRSEQPLLDTAYQRVRQLEDEIAEEREGIRTLDERLAELLD
ncbi:MAG TPA: hypothetical protein VD788_03840 [Candidatus Polarisedimenticolaceae bacterium]|nr:hypothetical protein [Candidatus Polarisedimenticolaceae bacterium]